VKIDGTKYKVSLFAKSEGKANTENKYDFPPPVDNLLFFGNCALVANLLHNEELEPVNLSVAIWNIIYENLFGGFENLNDTAKVDEEEEDELDNIPDNLKTKEGYLKDGFVVSSDEEVDVDVNDEELEIEQPDEIDEYEDKISIESDNESIVKKAPQKKRQEKKRFEKKHLEKNCLNDDAYELCEEEYEYDTIK
jgi:hypothetical protein